MSLSLLKHQLARPWRFQDFGKADPPATPDYAGAAQATAAGNLDAARVATQANRVNQVTPYGSLTYTHDPAAGSPDAGWTATQTLSPEEQAKLTKNQALANGLLDTAQQGLGSVNTLLSDPHLDESKLAQMPIQGQSVQDAVMSRLSPQIDRQREQLRTQLANQGIQQDSEAYRNAFTDQNQRENDLLTDASLRGINTGLTARQQGIQEQTYQQDRPLNVINALRTGNQVQNPNFVNVPQQQTTTGPDLLGAAQATYNANLGNYNAQQAGANNMMGGLFSLGSSFLGSPAGSAKIAGMFL